MLSKQHEIIKATMKSIKTDKNAIDMKFKKAHNNYEKLCNERSVHGWQAQKMLLVSLSI